MSLLRSIDDYLKLEGVNWSILKEMANSPLHFLHRKNNPREDSVTLARGRAIHTCVLEPELFSRDYIVFDGERRGNTWKDFKAQYSNKTILKTDEYDKARRAADAVCKHPEVSAILRYGEPEKTFRWKDPGTNLTCKCRVDWINGDVLFDLKSTTSVDARKFGSIAARMMYHAQVAMYADGAGHPDDVLLVAVESEPPYDVAVFDVGEDELQIGRELYQGFLMKVQECEITGLWQGRYPTRQKLSLPRYAYGDEEEGGSYEVVDLDAV